jgi:hypothetical protein
MSLLRVILRTYSAMPPIHGSPANVTSLAERAQPTFLLSGLLTGALLILSFVGWGTVVAWLVARDQRVGWPLRAAWGMAVVALFGGALNFFDAVSRDGNVVLLALGVVCNLAYWPRKFRVTRPPLHVVAPLAALVLVALAVLAASLYPLRWEPNDDAIAYAMFPKKMLETGSLVEPFSNRRIVSFGGYHYLHTLVLSLRSHHELHLLDRGIATVLTAALLVSVARRRLGASWLLACLAGVVFMLFPPMRVNLAPTCVLSLFSLGLLETFLLTGEEARLAVWRRAALLALVGGALLAMRANALAMLGLLTVGLVASESGRTLGRKVRLLALIGVFAAVLLVPWATALYRSCGTPFFPLVMGHYNTAVPMSVSLSPAAWALHLWENFHYAHLEWLVVLAAVGACLGIVSRAVLGYVAAALLTALATMAAFNLSGGFTMARYHGPFTVVAFVLVATSLVAAAQGAGAPSPRVADSGRGRPYSLPVLGAGAVAVCAVVIFALTRGGWRAELARHGFNPQAVLEARTQARYHAALPLRERYAAALATIPRHAKVLAVVDAPFLLDFRLHEIVCLDDIGVVSPPPGLPLSGGVGEPARLRDYLTALGFTHLLFVDPDKSHTIYARSLSQRTDLDPLWRLRAPSFLAFFAATDALRTTQPVLHDTDEAIVLAL